MKNKTINHSLSVSPKITGKRFFYSFLTIGLLSLFLLSPLVQAAFWIGDYSGEAEEYRLFRQGEELPVKADTLLEAGDRLMVLSETGSLHLLKDDDDSEILLDKDHSSFIVPKSDPSPSHIKNMFALIEGWISGSSTEKVKAVSASTRGDEPVLLLGVSDWKNNLPQGFDSLTAYWSGGKPPYRIHLIDKNDKVIAQQCDIQKNNVTLTDLNIPAGTYGLKVWGNSSSSIIELSIVPEVDLPPLYSKILKSRAPEKIKRSYSVLALASQPDWMFQSLQLAERYGLDDIKQKILVRNVPERIDEALFKNR